MSSLVNFAHHLAYLQIRSIIIFTFVTFHINIRSKIANKWPRCTHLPTEWRAVFRNIIRSLLFHSNGALISELATLSIPKFIRFERNHAQKGNEIHCELNEIRFECVSFRFIRKSLTEKNLIFCMNGRYIEKKHHPIQNLV